MSSPASRQRQRHRRRAQERVWAAQQRLSERLTVLAAYNQVLEDLNLRHQEERLSPFSGIALITTLRDEVHSACIKLQEDVTASETARKALEPAPATSDPKEILRS